MNYKERLKNIKLLIFDVDGVLTDGTVMLTEKGELLRTMHTKDGFAIKEALNQGFKIAIITGGNNQGVKERLAKLGITDIFLAVRDKLEPFYQLVDQYEISHHNILYMGDDIPDYQVMKLVGLACCPQDSCPEIKSISHYISHIDGGKGCVREIIEQLLKVQNKWLGTTSSKTKSNF